MAKPDDAVLSEDEVKAAFQKSEDAVVEYLESFGGMTDNQAIVRMCILQERLLVAMDSLLTPEGLVNITMSNIAQVTGAEVVSMDPTEAMQMQAMMEKQGETIQ